MKAPSLLAVAVPITSFPFKRVMLESASAIPVIVGVELFVIEDEVAREEGVTGIVVSIVMEIESDSDEIFPAKSVEVAFNEYLPSFISKEGVKEKAPLVLAVVVPNTEESINRVTFVLASALPVIVGVELFVIEDEVAKVEGAFGAVVSIVMEMESDSDEIFPAKSVEVAFNE